MKPSLFIFLFQISIGLFAQFPNQVYQTDNLTIIQVSPHAYQHITWLHTQDWGKVACNGMLVIDEGEALVFDTPSYDSVSNELIKWIEEVQNAEIKGVVVNHFHYDCLGGLKAFHEKGIQSYAQNLGLKLAAEENYEIPKNGFEESLVLSVGSKKVENRYFGKAHAPDNIASFLPGDGTLFGGCAVKSLKSGKGNLSDADPDAWSATILKVKEKWGKEIKVVIPGHGDAGGVELLDYTIEMFQKVPVGN
ncbi:MAG: subclass B1 metallo-beta-lactamase [Saprospiraceae bacterium]